MEAIEMDSEKSANDNGLGDLLLGARAIAEFLGIKPVQVYHLCYGGALPHFKVASHVAARRSTLQRWLEKQEAA
jgi:hypothetical protein